jgi:formylglycine-generating enzyme required for sulfatase activity
MGCYAGAHNHKEEATMKTRSCLICALALLAGACGGQPQAASSAMPPAAAPAGRSGATWARPADGMEMVYVPAGAFEMGLTDAALEALLQVLAATDPAFSRARWLDHLGEEQPAHRVRLDAFWIDRTEVTNAQVRRCVQAGACQAPDRCDPGEGEPTYADPALAQHPAVCVDWAGAAAYCAWAGGRLPTEAEWEYAARGPQGSRFPWGESWGQAHDQPHLNLCDARCGRIEDRDAGYDDGYARTAPVGRFPAGASWCGALDLAGNVAEWVGDAYQHDYYRVSPADNPTGPGLAPAGEGRARVRRGGGWDYGWIMVRATDRSLDLPQAREAELGFRCVVPAPAEEAATSGLSPRPRPQGRPSGLDGPPRAAIMEGTNTLSPAAKAVQP